MKHYLYNILLESRSNTEDTPNELLVVVVGENKRVVNVKVLALQALEFLGKEMYLCAVLILRFHFFY